MGTAKLRECARDHLAAVEQVLGERLDPAEQDSLAELLGRLGDAADGSDECKPGD